MSWYKQLKANLQLKESKTQDSINKDKISENKITEKKLSSNKESGKFNDNNNIS
jgi:hypothetical protein